MREIRQSKEFKRLEDEIHELGFFTIVNALEKFDSKFGGVKYEEYRIKEEDKKRSPEIMYGTQNEPTPPTPEELKKYHKQRPGTKGRR